MCSMRYSAIVSTLGGWGSIVAISCLHVHVHVSDSDASIVLAYNNYASPSELPSVHVCTLLGRTNLNFCFTSRKARKSESVGRSIFVYVMYESHYINFIYSYHKSQIHYFI